MGNILNLHIRDLINQTCGPAAVCGDSNPESLLGSSNIRFFSYGRHALLEGLRIIGVKSGDRVLTPGFICRDLLAAINSAGAVPVYYPVNEALQLDETTDRLPDAKAIMAVNYFGFPQDLRLFRDYCKKTGAVLIEDNAHGLFSRDESGQLLGTRGDIGIFSLRKTIYMPTGAALVLNNLDAGYELKDQIEFSSASEPFSFRLKRLLRKFEPLLGPAAMRAASSFVRYLRKLRSGHEIMPSLPDAEHVLPENPVPSSRLFSYLALVDVDKEIMRRRELYLEMDTLLKKEKYLPVFKTLPENVVPYGYPFYSSEQRAGPVRDLLKTLGLECFRWPELPDAVNTSSPEHYKTVWFVNFLR